MHYAYILKHGYVKMKNNINDTRERGIKFSFFFALPFFLSLFGVTFSFIRYATYTMNLIVWCEGLVGYKYILQTWDQAINILKRRITNMKKQRGIVS